MDLRVQRTGSTKRIVQMTMWKWVKRGPVMVTLLGLQAPLALAQAPGKPALEYAQIDLTPGTVAQGLLRHASPAAGYGKR